MRRWATHSAPADVSRGLLRLSPPPWWGSGAEGAEGARGLTDSYAKPQLSPAEQQKLKRVYDDLLELAGSEVPAVAAAARAALAQVHTALNGEGLHYELYSNRWND